MRVYSENPLKDLNKDAYRPKLSQKDKLHERAVILFCLMSCVGLFLKVVFF